MIAAGSLVARSLSVSLGGRQVLHTLDIELRSGELVCVLGENGAGKSTLLKTLAGLVQPDTGSVEIDGRPLALLDLRARARAIAYLPQSRNVSWPISVLATVALGRSPHRAGGPLSTTDLAAVDASLAAMDLTTLAKRPVTELSGGELARTLMARALAQGSDVILADEPTAGLDPAHALKLFEHLKSLAGQGRAIAVAAHDLSLAARFGARLVLLHQGRVLAHGKACDVLTTANLATAFHIEATLQVVSGLPVVITQRTLPS